MNTSIMPTEQRSGILRVPFLVSLFVSAGLCAFGTYQALTVEAAHVSVSVQAAGQAVPNAITVAPELSDTSCLPTKGPEFQTKLTPIETLQVGQRVRADAPTDEVDRQFGDEVIPSDSRKLTLTAPKRDGTVSDVVLLRPLDWIAQQQVEVNGQVYIAVPECGIDGNATVHSIERCPPITDGPGRIITGTFRHRVAGGIELIVAGESQPIRCTGNHPIWSETKQDFVRADSLQPGEALRTTTGIAHIVSTTSLAGETDVYNLEVHGGHVYHVGESGILVHNGNPHEDWRRYEDLVLRMLGIPSGHGFRQVGQVTPWGRRILDGLSDGHAIEVTLFDFRANFDADKSGNTRRMFNNKLTQLEKDAALLRRGRISRLTVVSPNALPTHGEGAAYTRRLLELREEFGKDVVAFVRQCVN